MVDSLARGRLGIAAYSQSAVVAADDRKGCVAVEFAVALGNAQLWVDRGEKLQDQAFCEIIHSIGSV